MAKTSQKQRRGKPNAAPPRGRKPVHKCTPLTTKVEQITGLLRRSEGASLDEMVKATGWQQHSLRGFMSGTIVKRKGLTIASEKSDGERRYRIVEAGTAS